MLRLRGGDLPVEDFLEKYRPEGKPSRKGSWFMCEEISELYHASPGPADVQVYLMELEPENPSRHHFGWVALINDVAYSRKPVSRADEDLLKDVVRMYWSGEPCPAPLMRRQDYGWEFLARNVQVSSCQGPTYKGLIR
jgi:hypothetical protein